MSVATDRELARELYEAAVAGVAAGPATVSGIEMLDLAAGRPVWLFAFGKAAHPMTQAAMATLHRLLVPVRGGIVVAPTAEPASYGAVVAMKGDHPVPGANSFAAAARIGELARGMKSEDAALVLISGGASSLIAAPLRGMGEPEFTHLYSLLLNSGLDITEMNAIRKRFARWSGGRLALALAPASTYCLMVSDVAGDDPSTIGSGPCVPDHTLVKDVVGLMEKAELLDELAPAYRKHLSAMKSGVIPDTPSRSHPAFAHVTARVVANNRTALEAAAEHAASLGVQGIEIKDKTLHGEAARAGENLARDLLRVRAESGGAGAFCRLWGGETTVKLRAKSPPRGGRCQEFALAAAGVLGRAGEAAAGITILAAGTDGHDGTSDASGACVDATTWAAICAAGRDPEAALMRHESFDALQSAGALLPAGHTGTNVGDIVVALCTG